MTARDLTASLPGFARFPIPLVATVFLVQIGLGLILFAVFQEYVPNELGASDAWPGYLIGAYGLARFVVETPAGGFGDKHERALAMLIGFTLMTPAIAVMAAVDSRFAFLGAAVLLGLGTGFLWPTSYAITADLYDQDRRGTVVALLNIAQLFGFGTGALAGALLVERAPVIVFIVALVAIAAAFATTARAIPPYRTRRLFGRPASVARRPSLSRAITPQLTFLAVLILLANCGLTVVFPAIRPLGEDQIGVSFATLTIALLPAVAIGAMAYVPAGRLTDRMGRTIPFFAGQALLVAGLLVIAETQSLAVGAAAATVAFVGNVITVPAMNAAVMDLAPIEHRGALIGISVALTGLGLALGPAAGGIITEEWGPGAAFQVAAVVSGITALAIVLYAGVFRRRAALPAL
ncbi:MAG: MFS transporter [Dehalococcoidia bacterium]